MFVFVIINGSKHVHYLDHLSARIRSESK